MSTTQRVSDEVWRSVPPKKLPAARVWTVLGLVVAVAVAGIWVERGGYVVPKLTAWVNGSAAKADSGTFDLRLTLTNEGSSDVTVTGFRTGASWLTVSQVTWPQGTDQGAGALPGTTIDDVLPLTLEPHSGTEVRLVLEVDCASRTSDAVPLLIDARALVGTHETTFQPEPSGPLVETSDGAFQPWPVPSADWVCTPYQGDDAE